MPPATGPRLRLLAADAPADQMPAYLSWLPRAFFGGLRGAAERRSREIPRGRTPRARQPQAPPLWQGRHGRLAAENRHHLPVGAAPGWFLQASASPDTALRNDFFRAYAAYMRTGEFGTAAERLMADAQDQPTVTMCSETLWWRCHRRLIADHCVLLAGLPVEHLMPCSRPTRHVPTQGVRRLGNSLRYDVTG